MPSFSSLFTIAAIATSAFADFVIYDHQDIQIVDVGGTDTAYGGFFWSGEPSCDDIGDSTVSFYNPNNDVSGDKYGAVCDGCDRGKAVVDFDITRYEVNRDDSLGHFTIYQDRDYGIYDTDGNQHGSCVRTTDSPDDYNCSRGTAAWSGVRIFECTSDLSV